MMSKERIAGFDGLRAIAFLLVFVSHKVTTLPHHDSYGVVGVWTFFVLSGFLITRILAGSREKVEIGETTPLAALGAFYLRRSARIFPIYYLILFIFLGLSLFVTIDDFWNLNRLAYFLFGTNFLIGWQNYWVGDFGHLWSLAVEEQFYLLVAPMILFAPRRWTMPICIAMLTISVVTTLVMEAMHVNRTTIDVNPIVNFGMLAYGGVIGLAARPFKSVWITNPAAPLATLAILIVIPWRLGEPEAFMGYGKLSALLSGLLILQIVQGQGSRFVAVLQSAPLRLIGRISYGAYLIHHFIHFDRFQQLLGPIAAHWTVPLALQVLWEFAATLVLATLSWVLLERPIIEWAARRTDKARRPVEPEPGATRLGPLAGELRNRDA